MATLVRPVGGDAARERKRAQGQHRAARGAFMGLAIATACLVLVLAVGPNNVKPGAVDRRSQATATLMHSVLAASSMYAAPAGKHHTPLALLKKGPMLEEEGEEHGEGEHGEHAEGGEGEEEGEEEESEEETLVRWGFFFVTIIIVFSVSFEMGVEFIKEAVPESMQEVVTALLEELTTLGFLGFAFFLFTVPISDGESLIEVASMYSLHEKEALKELFEGLHYLVFFISLSFIFCTIGGLLTFQLTGNKEWTAYEEDAGKAFTDPSILEIPAEQSNAMGGLLEEWRKPESVKKAEYLRLRCRFVIESNEPSLDEDFEYLKYLQEEVSETFSGMVKITPYDWLATWLLLALFFGIIQEGVTAKKMLCLYGYILSMIIVVCLLLQCKLVWIKQQLIPRLPSEMQSSLRRSAKIVVAPVFVDQSTLGKKSFHFVDYLPAFLPDSVKKLVKEYTKVRPGNKHERLFWFSAYGAEIMSHMIRLSMFWTIISLACLLSHHMPGIVKLGETLTGFKIFGHILFFLLAVLHIVAIATVYRNARIFTVITSVEMMQDRELIEKIVREQKYAKCQKAIDMLFTMNFYMQQAKWLKEQAENEKEGGETERSMAAQFVPKDDEEAKAYDELRELFEHFDSDGSGELGVEEVGELLATLGTNLDEEELAKLIKIMDKDGSGEVSLDELASVMLSRKSSKEAKLSDVATELFNMFDKDGEGEISLDEMVATFGQTGKNWDMEDVVAFFELIDLDKSGLVDREEFMQFINDVEAMSK